MAEASKLFDSSGGPSKGNKQDAVNSAGMTIMKLMVQSKFSGGSAGGMGGLMSMASSITSVHQFMRLQPSAGQQIYVEKVYKLIRCDYSVQYGKFVTSLFLSAWHVGNCWECMMKTSFFKDDRHEVITGRHIWLSPARLREQYTPWGYALRNVL